MRGHGKIYFDAAQPSLREPTSLKGSVPKACAAS